ncbi:MAG: hypothetical protein AABW92_05960 [Nanoarchaeota archaeon]
MIKFDKKSALAMIFVLIGFILILLFSEKIILIEALLFIFCFGFMLKFGSASPLDIDPVPFSILIVLYLNSLSSAFIFMGLSAVFIDLGTGRFNHFTLVNALAMVFSLVVFNYLLPNSMILIFGILLFNLTRIAIALIIGLGPQTVLFSIIHGIVYAVLGSVISLFI